MVVKRNFGSLSVLNKKIKICLGWDVNPLRVKLFHARNSKMRILHTLKGMVGYCIKDNGKEHFKFIHHNVFAQDMNDGKLEYAKFGKIGLNNSVCPSHSNTLQRAHQWAHFRMKKHLGVTLPGTLYHISKSGQFYTNSTCAIPLRLAGMDVNCAVLIWKIMMNHTSIDMKYISNVFFSYHFRCCQHVLLQYSTTCGGSSWGRVCDPLWASRRLSYSQHRRYPDDYESVVVGKDFFWQGCWRWSFCWRGINDVNASLLWSWSLYRVLPLHRYVVGVAFGSSASGSHDNHMSLYKLVRQIRARSKEEAF